MVGKEVECKGGKGMGEEGRVEQVNGGEGERRRGKGREGKCSGPWYIYKAIYYYCVRVIHVDEFFKSQYVASCFYVCVSSSVNKDWVLLYCLFIHDTTLGHAPILIAVDYNTPKELVL